MSNNPINDYGGPGGPGNIVSIYATNKKKKTSKLPGIIAPGHGGPVAIKNVLESILNQGQGGPLAGGYLPVGGDNGMSANAAEYRAGSAPASSAASSGVPGSGNGNGMSLSDYQSAAREIYQPSLDYLTGQEGAAKKRNANNDVQLKNMYAGLVRSIAGDASGIAGNYNDSIKQIAQGTQQAQAAVNNTYDQSANELAAMLQHLGIQAAAPDALKNNTRDEAFFKNMLGTSGQSVQNMLGQQRAGALEYNTAQQNISRQSGADARANNMLSLEDTLRQILGQKADLNTTINKQASDMQSSAVGNQIKQMQNQQTNDMKQARLALDTAKFQASQSQAGQTKADDPWTKLSMLAGSIYPDQNSTGNAVKAIRDTVTRAAQQGIQWKSPNEFINAVLSRNQGANDSPQLVQLATYLYQQLYGR